MEKQQTAVEWFWNQLPEILPFTVDTETAVKLQETYQQAKEMHRQEIINAVDGFPISNRHLDGSEYYEQTYGGSNK
jgi:hypothetical protein